MTSVLATTFVWAICLIQGVHEFQKDRPLWGIIFFVASGLALYIGD